MLLQLPEGDDVKSEAEAGAKRAEQLQLQIANGTSDCARMSCDRPHPLPPTQPTPMLVHLKQHRARVPIAMTTTTTTLLSFIVDARLKFLA